MESFGLLEQLGHGGRKRNITGVVFVNIEYGLGREDSMYWWYDFIDFCTVLGVIIGGAVLLVLLIAVPIQQIDTVSIPAQRAAIQDTLDRARKDNLGLEKAAATNSAMKFNQALATLKYYNNTWYGDLFINDCVDSVEPVR